MMNRGFGIRIAGLGLSALLLAGCAGTPPLTGGPTQALLAMPVPIYYANLRAATELTGNCARYEYDKRLDLAINEERNRQGKGSLAAFNQRDAIELETDVKKRSLAAKYGVGYAQQKPCEVLDAEVAAQTPLSAVVKKV